MRLHSTDGETLVLDAADGQNQTDQTRRIKRRRRRKSSKSQAAQDSSEYTEDENDSCNEVSRPNVPVQQPSRESEEPAGQSDETPVEKAAEDEVVEETESAEAEKVEDDAEVEDDGELEAEKAEANVEKEDSDREEAVIEISKEEATIQEPQEASEETVDEGGEAEVHCSSEIAENPQADEGPRDPPPVNSQKSELKPDAEEFIPRAYRNSEIPISPNVQFIKVPPSFIPIPIVPLGDFNGPNYNPAFIPSGIPINFLPPDPKMYPNFVGFVPNAHFVPRADHESEANQASGEETASNAEQVATCDNTTTAKDEKQHQTEKVTEKPLVQNVNSKTIDIATIVSKLEEAAKEQDDKEGRKSTQEEEAIHSSPRRRFNDNKINRTNQKYKNIPSYRRNNYNSAQSSPQRSVHTFKENNSTPTNAPVKEIKCTENDLTSEHKIPDLCNGVATTETKTNSQEQSYARRVPDNRRNWKYQGPQNGSPKWQPNSPVRSYKFPQNSKPITDNNVRDYKANQSARNYSATLKNRNHPSEQKHYERQVSEKQKSNHNEEMKTPTRQPKQHNQWISVSSRKKRKNKNADETEVSFEEGEDHSEKDLFEKYDVDQLVDVVPPSKEKEEVVEVETTDEVEIEDIISTITQNEASLINNMENISLNLTIRTVDDIEKELITKEPTETETPTPEPETVSTEKEIPDETSTPDVSTEINVSATEQEAVKTKSNKKSKKGTQKPITKRVIITDVDLSMKCEEIKTPMKKIVTKVSEKPNECVKTTPTPTEEKVEEKMGEDLPKRDDEEEKKKSKKKKKRPNKITITNSLSSSNTTLNNMDDSYDFLLDSALSPESVEKTNVEMSQELDKIIQKGMYSSLEEKIKSMNIDDSDGFFRSVFSNISNTKSGVEKNGFNKTLDLSKVLQDSRSLFRPSSVSEESNSHNKDINKVLTDLDSPAEDGIFLDTAKPTDDTPQSRTNDKHTDEETLNEEDTDEAVKDDAEAEPKTLYPITEAVKEWMCRTRETTPDVEILKSPYAIYREFCDSASETDTVVSDSTALGDEEVTIFTKDIEPDSEGTATQQPDLMGYWENDLGIREFSDRPSGNEKDPMLTRDQHIEQGEDVLEIYDSKYGKNEDYLNLQKEIKEKLDNSDRAKRGDLPYRAICCSIM